MQRVRKLWWALRSVYNIVSRTSRAQPDTAVQHCLENFGFQHPDLELEGGVRSVVQFEGILPEAAPDVAYAPVDLDGQVGVVVDVPLEVYEIVRLFVYLAGILDAECGGGIRYPLTKNQLTGKISSSTTTVEHGGKVTV